MTSCEVYGARMTATPRGRSFSRLIGSPVRLVRLRPDRCSPPAPSPAAPGGACALAHPGSQRRSIVGRWANPRQQRALRQRQLLGRLVKEHPGSHLTPYAAVPVVHLVDRYISVSLASSTAAPSPAPARSPAACGHTSAPGVSQMFRAHLLRDRTSACTIRPAPKFTQPRARSPPGLMPLCRKNRRSSIATVARCQGVGMSLRSTGRVPP